MFDQFARSEHAFICAFSEPVNAQLKRVASSLYSNVDH